ncbi:MAG: VWA domain-containing protein [Acidimicrobiales bacterium]
MRFANPAALWLGLLALPILALHVLAPRRPPLPVGSTFLWREVADPVSVTRPWQRLRPSALLAAQLAAVFLLAAAAAQPVRPTPVRLADHTVFIVDASGSMAAADGRPARLDVARAKAGELRRQLPSGGSARTGLASIVVADRYPRVALTASADVGSFVRAMAAVETTAGGVDWGGAFRLAESLETPGVPVGFVLLSDGGIPDDQIGLIPAGTRFEAVGASDVNRGIARLTAEPRGSSTHVRATVTSTGGPASAQSLRFDLDGRTVAHRSVTLAPGATQVVELDLPAGERVTAFLEGEDLLAADNRAVAVVGKRRDLRILHAGGPNIFLDRLLAVLPGVSVERSAETRPAPGFDVAIYDRVAVPADPGAPVWAIAPPGGLAGSAGPRPGTAAGTAADPAADGAAANPANDANVDPTGPTDAGSVPSVGTGIAVTGEVASPSVALVRTRDPLLDGLDLSELAIGRAQRLVAPTAEILVAAEDAPLLLRSAIGGRPATYLAFALHESTLALDVAFPILADRILAELSGAAPPPGDLVVGQPLPLAGGPLPTGAGAAGAGGASGGDPGPGRPGSGTVNSQSVVVEGPRGIRISLSPGAAAPVADRAGFWTLTNGDRPPVTVAVNADPAESHLRPVRSLAIAPAPPDPDRPTAAPGQRSILLAVVILLLAVLALEAVLARRRRGVPARQWRMALVARAVVALALIGAVAGLGLPRPSNRVAVVFLVDGSDSLGAGGRAEAREWIRRAMEAQPPGAVAGVAYFGGDARLDLTVGPPGRLSGAGIGSTRIDTTRTDLAGGLRLAAAVLPSDARRRVVVVSDGRLTDGDAAGEARRLRQAGIEIDVHQVSRGAGPDASVARLDVPGRVRPGEAFVVRATVSASSPGPARLIWTRDGRAVADQAVELSADQSVFELPQVLAADAQPGGVAAYGVRVSRPDDVVAENDVGFAGVRVAGGIRVLVAEGQPGVGGSLAEALRAGGIPAEVIAATDLGGVGDLAGYAATVMVDVDGRSLSTAQVDALGAATRDLGRGLVVVGGDRSYALGGYLGSPLEELLPVISDVTDPARRASVAEVLAIDSSGSMGACHCSEGGANGLAGGANGGGVNKTDISRAAAARTVAALAETDQLGILAFNTEQRWIVPLAQLPTEEVVTRGLRSLRPAGGTDLALPLVTAGEALAATKARLKHVILFTDGFSSPEALRGLEAQARTLADQGITVSVLATGETGASENLNQVAAAGRGRFYNEVDLAEIPQIMANEAVLASRRLVNEGEMFPSVVSSSPVVSGLTRAPALLGYLGTTARPTARTLLEIGEDGDPLLATWQLGLGRATAWTSDGSARWAANWARWGGYAPFWSAVVKDTFAGASSAAAEVRADIEGGRLRVTVTSEEPWPDGATAEIRLSPPAGATIGPTGGAGSGGAGTGTGGQAGRVLTAARTSDRTFAAEVSAAAPGTYALGANVTGPGGEPVFRGDALAVAAYSAEYQPGEVDPNSLLRISSLAGGRGAIDPAAAFDPEGLDRGPGRVSLVWWLLLTAALLWPVAVALSRLALRGAVISAVQAAPGRLRGVLRQQQARRHRPPPPPEPLGPGGERRSPRRRSRVAPSPPPATVEQLLARKRRGPGAGPTAGSNLSPGSSSGPVAGPDPGGGPASGHESDP